MFVFENMRYKKKLRSLGNDIILYTIFYRTHTLIDIYNYIMN